MYLDFLFERFKANKKNPAIIWKEEKYSYNWLLDKTEEVNQLLKEKKINSGDIVALRSDFNPFSIAFLLSLIENRNITVPISFAVKTLKEFYSTAEVEKIIEIQDEQFILKKRKVFVFHELLLKLRKEKHPGLILFSSGSTGKSKASVHDFVPLLNKFKIKRKTLRTITFLLFDHIGGINTLLYILSNTGTIVAPEDRSPESICKLIEKYKVELLPTSPTFINMILISRAYEKYDISSLKLVTYGTETMPESTLRRFHKLFPNIKLKQTYGLSELGILRSISRNSNSLWVKVGGEDYQTKVVDNILYVKAKTSMLGYLNAPSPFDRKGWFNTQDRVEVDGQWIKILGRDTDIINVGGLKVYPTEVESVLLEMSNIIEAVVFPMSNPIMGNVVAAKVVLEKEESLSSLKKRIRKFCKNKLESYKIPAYITISSKPQVSDRFKKTRT